MPNDFETLRAEIAELRRATMERFDGVDERLSGHDGRFDGIDRRVNDLDTQVDGHTHNHHGLRSKATQGLSLTGLGAILLAALEALKHVLT